MFYIKENENIVLIDENKENLIYSSQFYPQYKDFPIMETKDNEIIVDFKLMATDENKKNQEKLETLNKIQELKKSLADLDSKRIRAVCEMEIKDTQTGETWLNYYNSQIKTLREELALLQV